MRKLTSVIGISLIAILFTACSPKVAESTTTSTSDGSSSANSSSAQSSSSSSSANGFSGEGRHQRNPKLVPADKLFKRPTTPTAPILIK